MEDNYYGEPTDSLRSIMKILWGLEDTLWRMADPTTGIVNKQQVAYMKKTAKEMDRLTGTLQYIIDLGDE